MAIQAAGGPAYSFADVAPTVPDEFGGVPCGNIRNAYLWNDNRVSLQGDVYIIDNTAFDGSRPPLVGTFEFNGEDLTVVNVHFSSRFGSTPVYGGPQPFVQAGEAEREAQSKAVNAFVDTQLGIDPQAAIAVVGDHNTFEFTDELTEDLPGTGPDRVLTNLIWQAVEADEAYTFIFDGNSQVLDHAFVTDRILPNAQLDIVHVNNDFTRDDNQAQDPDIVSVVASDHEPLLVRIGLTGIGKSKSKGKGN
jgi:predicted extracellular nuclease